MECEERVVGERQHTEEENVHHLIVRASKGGRGGLEGGDGRDRCLGVTVRVTRVQRGILKEPDHHLKMSTSEGKGTRKATDLTPVTCIILSKATPLVLEMVRGQKGTNCCLASGHATGTV